MTELKPAAFGMTQPLGPVRKPGLFWRIAQFPVTRACVLGISTTALLVIMSVVRSFWARQGPVLATLLLFMAAGGSVLFYALLVRVIERRRPSEFSPRLGVHEFGAGALLGLVAISLTVALMWMFGTYHVTGVNPPIALVTTLAIGLVPAFGEEILFRGVLYRIIEGSLGTWAALLITSVLFGAAHLSNPHASWFAALAIAIEAGLMLGAAYTLTQRLWLPIGMHFAWNWAQGGLYGVPVSGIVIRGLLSARVNGPDLLAGGGFGAEATVLAIGVCVLIFIGLMAAVYRRNMLILPVWQRRHLVLTGNDGQVSAQTGMETLNSPKSNG